ncbi:MAG: hypothetical protein HY360_17665 [Verrucomicrobia bacterium]|nr:hypothetical protein [Verrucomicrobiota bacterium]
MKKHLKSLDLAIVALCLCAFLSSAALAKGDAPRCLSGASPDVQELPDGAVRVENKFYTLEIATKEGGRIRSLIVKETGDNLIYWDPKEQLGGLLDDKSFTSEPFKFQITRPEARTAVVSLDARNDITGIAVRKTLTFRADTPAIALHYRAENRSQAAINRAGPILVRNIVRPGGKDITPADIYCLPTSAGIFQADAHERHKNPDTSSGFTQKISAPWMAFINRDRRQGLAFVYLDDALAIFYQWCDSVVYPTLEWGYRPLEAGTALETSLMFIPVSGLSGVSWADQQVILNVSKNGTIEARAVAKPLQDIVLEVADVDAAGAVQGSPVKVNLNNLEAAKTGQASFTRLPIGLSAVLAQAGGQAAPAAPANAVMRRFTLSGQGKTLAVFHDAIDGKTRNVSGTLKPYAAPAAKVEQFKDWKKIEFKPVIAETDRQRGYALFSREDSEAGKTLAAMQFDLAPGLRESQFVALQALKELGEVMVAVKPTGKTSESWLREHVLVRRQTGIPIPKNEHSVTGEIVQLKSVENWSPRVNVEERLWLTVRGRGTEAGDYPFELRIQPAQGAPFVLPVQVKIWPVKLPEHQRVTFEAEHVLTLLPGANYRDQEGKPSVQPGWQLPALEVHVQNLADHGVNVAQAYTFLDAGWAYIKIAGSDKSLGAAINADPLFLLREPLPELDFSYFNPWLDTARRNGLWRFDSYTAALIGDKWASEANLEAARKQGGALAKLAAQPPKEVAHRIDVWFWGQLFKYIVSRDYQPQDIFMKVLDKLPLDQTPKMARIMGVVKEAGWRPQSSFSTLFRYPEQTRMLDQVIGLWMFGTWNYEEYQARLAAGDLKGDAEKWSYDGWGVSWAAYQNLRARGWEAAFSRRDGFHAHEYYRWLPYTAIVSMENNRPIDSPAWEGLSDGMADAQLLAALLHELGAWERQRGLPADQDPKAGAILASIVGGNEKAILPIRLVSLERGIRGMSVIDAGDQAGADRYRRARRAVLTLLAQFQQKKS